MRTLRRLVQGIHEYSKAIQRRTGLSGPQVWALNLLAPDGGISLGELAGRMYAHPSTVSGVVDRLVRRRAVRRRVDPADRRGVRLSLTPRGRDLLRRSPPPVQIGLQHRLERMPAARRRQLHRLLEELAAAAETHRKEPPFLGDRA